MSDQVKIKASNAGRLDTVITAQLSELSRSRVQQLIKDGLVLVDGAAQKANFQLKGGEEVLLTLPQAKPISTVAQEIPLDIRYEDKDIIVVNKPQGMVVHPSHGHSEGTLVNALLHHCPNLSGINGQIRPGIVHRIDKDTSGLLVAALNDTAHRRLAEQWKKHDIKRVYYALLNGQMAEPAGRIDAPIGRHPRQRLKMAVNTDNGRQAVTNYRVLERFDNYSLVECCLETGRTHQIRVHMAYLGHPVVGDPLYGHRKCAFDLNGQALHAAVLGFNHPQTGEYLEFAAELPEYFEQILLKIRK